MSQATQSIKFARDLVASHMNKVASRYYLHNHDEDANGNMTCYFSQDGVWGFWVHEDGSVWADETVGDGKLPSKKIVDACVRAAKKYLN